MSGGPTQTVHTSHHSHHQSSTHDSSYSRKEEIDFEDTTIKERKKEDRGDQPGYLIPGYHPVGKHFEVNIIVRTRFHN